jgi:hypothetical protein
MKNVLFCSIALILALSSSAWAQPSEKRDAMQAPKPTEKDKSAVRPAPAPTQKPPSVTPPESTKKAEGDSKPAKPSEPAATCTLLTKEAPRGGRLEVQGGKLGKSPVVKIGGAVTRIIERPGDKIAVQIPPKSDGGAVIVRVDGKDIECGTLEIIGLD